MGGLRTFLATMSCHTISGKGPGRYNQRREEHEKPCSDVVGVTWPRRRDCEKEAPTYGRKDGGGDPRCLRAYAVQRKDAKRSGDKSCPKEPACPRLVKVGTSSRKEPQTAIYEAHSHGPDQ